jgi:L-fuculose-phosphate aldolase
MRETLAYEDFRTISYQLKDQGLFEDDTQIMVRGADGKTVFGADGAIISPDEFDGIDAAYGVLSSAKYSFEYSKTGRAVTASSDDMAMMFGYSVDCADKAGGGAPAYLLKGRGFLVTGRFISEVVAACILMEKMCKTELLASAVGSIQALTREHCEGAHEMYIQSYSAKSLELSGTAPGAQTDGSEVPDLEARLEVIKYGKLLVENHLIQATWGNISLKLDDDRFLITPSGVDYDRIRPEEVVEVSMHDGTFAEGMRPSSERPLHWTILKARPDFGAVIHTHSGNCQVLAACHEGIKAEGIDCPCAGYGPIGSEELANNVAAVIADHEGAIMANHGFITGGADLADALDKAMKAEAAAGSMLGI